MNSRQLCVAEHARLVTALYAQKDSLAHLLAHELANGYVFVVESEQDAQLLAGLIAKPVGASASDSPCLTLERTLQTDLLEDR